MKVYDLVIALAELKSEHGNKTLVFIQHDKLIHGIDRIEYVENEDAIVIFSETEVRRDL